MQSKAPTVAKYLAELPPERRAAIQAVRETILANLDRRYEEGMHSGIIAYYVPHSVYPPGYHCDPKQPLPFAGLASQKNYMSVYLMSVYAEPAIADGMSPQLRRRMQGKSCFNFTRIDEPLFEELARITRESFEPQLARAARVEAERTPAKTR